MKASNKALRDFGEIGRSTLKFLCKLMTKASSVLFETGLFQNLVF